MIDGRASRAIAKSCLTSRSLSPIHLETRSELETEKKVELDCVAIALARYDLPVPGGPYSRMPLHGLRLPVKSWGNLMGRITASLSASFAVARPATSSQLTLGRSDRITLDRPERSFLVSASTPSSPSSAALVAPPPPLLGAAVSALCTLARCSLSFSARSRYSTNLARMSPLSFSFFSSALARQRTLHRHHKVVETVLVLHVRLLIVMFYIFVDRALHDINRTLR